MTPILSIVVIVFNSAPEVELCLQSLKSQLGSDLAELVVVDNASPDDSMAIVRSVVPDARVLTLSRNLGFAQAANHAIAASSGEYVLLLNPDVVMPPGTVRALIDWMHTHPWIGIASPNVVSGLGSSDSPARAQPALWRILLETSRLHKLLPKKMRSRYFLGSYWDGTDVTNAGWVPGTAMIVRREAFEAAGLMRDDLFMYGEDLEWCSRIRRTGYCVGVTSSITVRHEGSTSARRSWGEAEKERRVELGVHQACIAIYGPAHASLIALALSLATRVQACDWRQDRVRRERLLESARHWLTLAQNTFPRGF